MAANTKEKKTKICYIVTGILLVISVGLTYLVHVKVPFMMDDLWYSTQLMTDEPIASFADILNSQIWHYLNWGGRSITHTILQITLLLGEPVADLCNVAVTLFLAWMICVVSGNRKILSFFAAFGMLFGLNANWKMSMFWHNGAANYLYITGFILLFLYCYLCELGSTEETRINVRGGTFWIVPLGLVTGWSNENMGPMAWVISLIVILLCLKEKKKIKAWMLLGNISCLLGSILMIAAPGNFVRSAQVVEREYGTMWKLFLHCYAEATAVCCYLFPTVLITAFVLIISKGVLHIPIGIKNSLLMFGALLSWGAMLLSPHYPDRATFGTMVLLICVIVSVCRDIVKERNELELPLWGISILIWLRGMYYLGEFLALCWGWIQ